ncbi:RNA-directed DNA polymerase from mobile element jockey [Trichonephila clavipes]|uniref:RNA-directed DNA polymerase from mobile element jockey n=1 Tax=Trichonephila clavipes TaxID=2585209 RepID=A0A8X6WG95_TRICX|nr:RNA-directed DNA polymerase from mobile element jockey [Trichonephila clavipes]
MKQLNSTGENNSTQKQERNNSTRQKKPTQLVSRNETTQFCTAVDRLQPPTTACTAFTAELAFSTYSPGLLRSSVCIYVSWDAYIYWKPLKSQSGCLSVSLFRGLPSNTEPEDIKTEIEAEGFKVAKISQTKNYRTKAPMPLFYLQIENGGDAQKIFDFTELFGTRIEEIWLEPGIEPHIANYRLFKDDRIDIYHTHTRDGTAIYCKSEIVHSRVLLPEMQGIDATAVQVKIKNFPPLNIVSAYIRNNVRHIFPLEDFKTIFNFGSNCIIAGDYNAAHVHWHYAKSTRYRVALCNLIRNLRGAKLVTLQTATHLQPCQWSGSIIDLAMFKHTPFNHSIRVHNDLSFDQYPVILEINLNTSIIKNPEQLSTNWNNFKFALNKKPVPTLNLPSNENIELATSELNQNFSEALVEATKPKFKNAPKTLSSEIKSKIHQRNRLRKFWQRTRCPSIYSEFRTLSREIAKDIKSHSRTQLEKHIEALLPIDNTLWRKFPHLT